jgi:hypothetical protein
VNSSVSLRACLGSEDGNDPGDVLDFNAIWRASATVRVRFQGIRFEVPGACMYPSGQWKRKSGTGDLGPSNLVEPSLA